MNDDRYLYIKLLLSLVLIWICHEKKIRFAEEKNIQKITLICKNILNDVFLEEEYIVSVSLAVEDEHILVHDLNHLVVVTSTLTLIFRPNDSNWSGLIMIKQDIRSFPESGNRIKLVVYI